MDRTIALYDKNTGKVIQLCGCYDCADLTKLKSEIVKEYDNVNVVTVTKQEVDDMELLGLQNFSFSKSEKKIKKNMVILKNNLVNIGEKLVISK